MILWFHHYSEFSEVNALAQHHDPLATAVGEIAQMVSIPSTQIKVAEATDFINGQKAALKDIDSDIKDAKRRIQAHKRSLGITKPKKTAVKVVEAPQASEASEDDGCDSEGSASQ